MQRRQFLKVLSAGATSILLAGCGSSVENFVATGSVGRAPLPNGYLFVPLLDTGSTVAAQAGGPISKFPGSLLINNLGQALVHVQSGDSLQLLLLQTSQGAVVETRRVIGDGDSLPGGHRLARLGLASLNHAGEIAFAARHDNGDPAIYKISQGETLLVATPGQTLLGSDESVLSNILGDFELLQDGTLLLVAGYGQRGNPRTLRSGQALIRLTSPGRNTEGSVIARTGDSIPGSADTLGHIGMIDCDGRDPSFVHQGLAARPPITTEVPTGDGRTLLLAGSLEQERPRLLARGKAVEVAPVLARTVPEGSSAIGPRVNGHGQVASVIEQDGADTLYLEGQPLLRTGQLSPLGETIRALSSPVVGPKDLVFGQLFTDSGSEIYATDGRRTVTYLSTGVTLNGRTIRTLAFGLVRDMVDDDANLVCLAEFSDGSQSALLGVPH